jgi:hypothetical protein
MLYIQLPSRHIIIHTFCSNSCSQAVLKHLTVIDTIDDMLVAIFEHGKPFKRSTLRQDTVPMLC